VKTPHEQAAGWPAARARFWTEFREGQREAEAHSSRRRWSPSRCRRSTRRAAPGARARCSASGTARSRSSGEA